jgi:hypothetical protein
MKLISRAIALFVASVVLTLGINGAAGIAGAAVRADARHATNQSLPSWFHTVRAPRYVARSACGTYSHGAVIPAVETWASNRDGVVICRNGKVATP